MSDRGVGRPEGVLGGELWGHVSSWVGVGFDLGALEIRSSRELLNQPVYFNESLLQLF